MKAFLLAAGFGTRLRPFTNHHPKALAEVNGKSLLERNILQLQTFGIFDVVINVHHHAEQIIQTIEKNNGFGSRINISDESHAILETGGGLMFARKFLLDNEPVLMMNVDILSHFDFKKMLSQHDATKPLATLAVQERNSSRTLLFNLDNTLCGWRNWTTGEIKPSNLNQNQTLKSLAFSGIQIISQEIFQKIKQEGKFSIMTSYLDLCQSETIKAWNHSGDLWLDVGKPESLEKAAYLFKS